MRKQDRTGFQELYERYANDVFRFAFWLSGDSDAAKDITAETFTRVWLADSETRLESVKAYLFTIARNLHLQQFRRTRKFSTLHEDVPDTSVRTEREVADRSELEHTLTMLRRLPELDRAVLIMRAFDELTYEEISEATGLSLAAVKVKVFRARAKLAALMSQSQGGAQ